MFAPFPKYDVNGYQTDWSIAFACAKQLGMKLAVMQPYFLPYVGYFQLVAAVDKFVIYDNIQFTKKGWINRNRILVNGKDQFITIPLKNDSDYLDINKRQLADTFEKDKEKILRRIKEAYRNAPHFPQAYSLMVDIFNYPNRNLFMYVFNSVKMVCEYLDIQTEFIQSSLVNADHSLRAEKRVLSIVTEMKADTYVNPVGGIDLYSKEDFKTHGVVLKFLQSDNIVYSQFNNTFVPWLSILDLLMFNPQDTLSDMMRRYKLI